MKRMHWIIGLVLACTLVLFAFPAMAQDSSPQVNAEHVRQALFTAQSKLLLGDQAAGVERKIAEQKNREQREHGQIDQCQLECGRPE